MKAHEFIEQATYDEYSTNEDFKSLAAAGMLGTALAFTPAAAAKSNAPVQRTVTGNPHEVILKKAAISAGIKDTELSAFLSQCAHETLNFTRMVEKGGKLDFKKYDPRFAPKKAKILGNVKPGDGELYKGRGYIQLTGRYNYRKAGEALGLPLEKYPHLAESPEIAAKIAVWYWKNKVRPNVTNFGDVPSVTKKINPALHGLHSRVAKFKDFNIASLKPTTKQN